MQIKMIVFVFMETERKKRIRKVRRRRRKRRSESMRTQKAQKRRKKRRKKEEERSTHVLIMFSCSHDCPEVAIPSVS